jgi:repressor LexA
VCSELVRILAEHLFARQPPVEQVFVTDRRPAYSGRPNARSDGGPGRGGAPGQEAERMRADPTERQRRILEVISTHLEQRGYPPSVREIGEAVGLSSPSSVHAQLAQLEAKGFLRRDPTKPRALEVRVDRETDLGVRPAAARHVPLVGDVAAGAPVIAEERVESVLPLPRDLVGEGTLFMLRIRGESMIEAGVLPGDLVVVRQQPTVEQGEMCAALIDGEATVKFFRRTRSGQLFLDPANPAYEPIPLAADQDVRIMGRVVSVLRTL